MSGNSGQDHFTMGRPFKVFVAGLFSSFVLIIGGLYAESLDNPGQIYTLIATLVAAPPLFVVWMFRDEDKQRDIENTRIETQIKDFHRVEEWATSTDLDATNPALRIAAIHQLRPYLVGEHGDGFRRPAYEIYKALLNSWDGLERDRSGILSKDAVEKLWGLEPPQHIKAIHTVIREILRKEGAWAKVFTPEMPLNQLNLIRADLPRVHLERANLLRAQLSGAILNWAHLEGTHIVATHLEEASCHDIKINRDTRIDEVVYSNETLWEPHHLDIAGAQEPISPPMDGRFIHIDVLRDDAEAQWTY